MTIVCGTDLSDNANQAVNAAFALARLRHDRELVITHVPWLGLTPRSPAIAGIETLAIEESSTFMKVASESTTVPSTSWPPFRGGGGV